MEEVKRYLWMPASAMAVTTAIAIWAFVPGVAGLVSSMALLDAGDASASQQAFTEDEAWMLVSAKASELVALGAADDGLSVAGRRATLDDLELVTWQVVPSVPAGSARDVWVAEWRGQLSAQESQIPTADVTVRVGIADGTGELEDFDLYIYNADLD